MTEKIQKRFRLSAEALDYIEEYTDNNNIPRGDQTEGLERIIKEHKQLSKQNWNLQYITETVTENVTRSVQIALQQNIVKGIDRVRLGTNNADRNTQILIELLQGFMQMQNVEQIVTTDIYKPTFLTEAENLVHEKITTMKQKKDNKNQKES